MRGAEALHKLLTLEYKTFQTVLDVGSGEGHHAQILRDRGKTVTTLDFKDADICGDFLSVDIPHFDVIWCCHVLEHQQNVGLFLQKALDHCDLFVVTVPPAKHNIVGGHLTLWNAGLLLYNLVQAGFDCSNAKVKAYGYNISVIVEAKRRPDVPLKMDCGDIEALAPFFPFKAEQGFNGDFPEVNW